MHKFPYIILAVFLLATACERRAEIKKIPLNGIELAYYIRGQGEPLIMIMGFKGTMALWDPALLQELEKKYTLILFDNRGVGLSTDTTDDQTTISQMAQDTADLIKALGYTRVNVLGWSMGSRIAMKLTLDHPEMVNTLILCSPNPGGKHQAFRKTDAYAELTTKQLTPKEALALLFPDTAEGRLASSELVSRMTSAIEKGVVPDDLKISDQTVQRQKHALDLWDENDAIYNSLSKIKTPTLVAIGSDDVLDQPENARIIVNQIPLAWAAYFPGSGHAFVSQNYLQLSRLVSVFIDSQKKNEF